MKQHKAAAASGSLICPGRTTLQNLTIRNGRGGSGSTRSRHGLDTQLSTLGSLLLEEEEEILEGCRVVMSSGGSSKGGRRWRELGLEQKSKKI